MTAHAAAHDASAACLKAERERDQARGAMAAQDERERVAGERCGVSAVVAGCDWPEAVADAVLTLRAERDAGARLLARERDEARALLARCAEMLPCVEAAVGDVAISCDESCRTTWADRDAADKRVTALVQTTRELLADLRAAGVEVPP